MQSRARYSLFALLSGALICTALTAGCGSSGAGGGRGGAGGGASGAAAGGATGGPAGAGGIAGGRAGSGGLGGSSSGGAAGVGGAAGTAGSGQAGGTAGSGGSGGRAGGPGAAGRGGASGAGGTAGAIGAGGRGGAAGQAGAAGGCPSQSAVDPSTTSIAGTWDFTPAGASKRSIQVPGGGWLKQGINASTATYATQVTVPDSGGAQTTLIEFGAVNFQATLSVDGKEAGTNTTSFTPSVFDVSKFVTPGKQHAISVLVKGAQALKSTSGKYLVPNAAGWSPNIAQGIFRSALLHVYPDVYVSDVFVRTSVTDDTLTYDVAITNTGRASQDVTLSGALASWSCDPFTYPIIADKPVSVAPGTTTVTVGPVKWGLGTTSYWWPNVPYQSDYQARLHSLTVQLTRAGKAIHSRAVRFGFRQSERRRADASHIYYYLNGIRVNYRGDNLQGANYDSIDNGGRGDAYDTLPGFLPPSAQSPGWPQAVRNYQRLNYNVIRIHQELAAPYMLDVADELGLMLIGETAIRGSNNDQDFVAGHDNMVAHARAMVLRDRNHPAIVRWSQSNEPSNADSDSNQFEADLFNAITKLDPTRPISSDVFLTGPNYGLPVPAFATIGHYIGGLGAYTDLVNANNNNPAGQGEYIWPKDNSRQGLTWFGTSAMAMRRQDASEVRPYTLLSGWASFVPGVRTTQMTLEQGGPPALGEDNLPDPWSSPIIRRIQHGFHPVLVADQSYWDANKNSNANGDWPASIPTIAKGATRTTNLIVFNDTFAETSIDLTWEVHADSPTGAIASSATLKVDVPLASSISKSITMTAPTSGTKCYLVLRAAKAGTTLFEETDESFTLQ
jgi:Glycosyl hydrolases family 2, TIM barrel domain/Glycosyl hydrolases family 2, sugar binding domain/Glycosyl hydrolases family 2